MASQTSVELLNQLQQLLQPDKLNGAVSKDPKQSKKEACDIAFKLFRQLEEPGEMVTRLITQTTENPIIATSIDLNIFEYLLKQDNDVSSKQVASHTGAEEALVNRLLRFLAAHDYIAEVDVDMYRANKTTEAFVMPKAVGGFEFLIDVGWAAWRAIPAHLKSTNYRAPADPLDTPLQYGLDTKKHFFDILVERNIMSKFQMFMGDYRSNRAEFLDIYPADKNLLPGFDSSSNDSVLFVDVGGGRGHEIEKFQKRFPQEKKRMLLQDLPYVVQEVEDTSNMEVMTYDFFTPQPVKGARCYHFRMIFHDWPNDYCLKILANTASAMKHGYSKILISDVVLPDKGALAFQTESDIGMLSLLGAMERSGSQWKSLLERAGLKIVRIWPGNPESVVEAELA